MTDFNDVNNFALEVYDSLGAYSEGDALVGYQLLAYVGAQGQMWDDVEELSRDTDDYPGWAILFDPDNVPFKYLAYTAQFVGVRLINGLSEADQRIRVKSVDGWSRGSVGAIRAAAQAHLTGAKHVVLRERYDPDNPTVDSAYHLFINTYTAETPDSGAVLAALMAQKPAGIVLHYEVVDGQDYQSLLDNHPLYSDVAGDFANYGDVRDNTP